MDMRYNLAQIMNNVFAMTQLAVFLVDAVCYMAVFIKLRQISRRVQVS